MTKNQEVGSWGLAGYFVFGVGLVFVWWPLAVLWVGLVCICMAIVVALNARDSFKVDFKDLPDLTAEEKQTLAMFAERVHKRMRECKHG